MTIIKILQVQLCIYKWWASLFNLVALLLLYPLVLNRGKSRNEGIGMCLLTLIKVNLSDFERIVKNDIFQQKLFILWLLQWIKQKLLYNKIVNGSLLSL